MLRRETKLFLVLRKFWLRIVTGHTVDLPDAVKLGGSYDGGWLLQCVYRVA